MCGRGKKRIEKCRPELVTSITGHFPGVRNGSSMGFLSAEEIDRRCGSCGLLRAVFDDFRPWNYSDAPCFKWLARK